MDMDATSVHRGCYTDINYLASRLVLPIYLANELLLYFFCTGSVKLFFVSLSALPSLNTVEKMAIKDRNFVNIGLTNSRKVVYFGWSGDS